MGEKGEEEISTSRLERRNGPGAERVGNENSSDDINIFHTYVCIALHLLCLVGIVQICIPISNNLDVSGQKSAKQ